MKIPSGFTPVVLLGLLVVACDQDVWEDTTRLPVSVASPQLPALACPAGWWAVVDPRGCEPWPESGRRDDCAFDEAHFPGRPGCEGIGAECGADGWPVGLPSGGPIFYVDDEAPAGGDGTRERPYAAIGEVGARPGIIAVASGIYGGATVRVGQTLWGACVEGTRITGQVTVHEGATVRNLAVEPAGSIGIFGMGWVEILVEDVVVARARDRGVRGGGTFRRVVVRDTRSVEADDLGDGFSIERDATLEDVVVERAAGSAVAVTMLADASIRGLAVRETAGDAVRVGGGSLVLERAVLEESRWGQISVTEGALDATDVVARESARGIFAGAGAMISLARVRVERAGGGVVAADGGRIHASDVVIRDAGPSGYGMRAERDGEIMVERVLVEQVPGYGVASDEDGRISGHDLTIRDVSAADPDLPWPFGIGMWCRAANLTLSRVVVERATYAGVVVVDRSRVTLEDLILAKIGPSPCGATVCPEWVGGFGVVSHLGSDVTARRFLIHDAQTCGVVVSALPIDEDMTRGFTWSRMLLEDGKVSGSETGACVQITDFDTSTLRNNVAYVDLGASYRETAFALPESLAR